MTYESMAEICRRLGIEFPYHPEAKLCGLRREIERTIEQLKQGGLAIEVSSYWPREEHTRLVFAELNASFTSAEQIQIFLGRTRIYNLESKNLGRIKRELEEISRARLEVEVAEMERGKEGAPILDL